MAEKDRLASKAAAELSRQDTPRCLAKKEKHKAKNRQNEVRTESIGHDPKHSTEPTNRPTDRSTNRPTNRAQTTATINQQSRTRTHGKNTWEEHEHCHEDRSTTISTRPTERQLTESESTHHRTNSMEEGGSPGRKTINNRTRPEEIRTESSLEETLKRAANQRKGPINERDQSESTAARTGALEDDNEDDKETQPPRRVE